MCVYIYTYRCSYYIGPANFWLCYFFFGMHTVDHFQVSTLQERWDTVREKILNYDCYYEYWQPAPSLFCFFTWLPWSRNAFIYLLINLSIFWLWERKRKIFWLLSFFGGTRDRRRGPRARRRHVVDCWHHHCQRKRFTPPPPTRAITDCTHTQCLQSKPARCSTSRF